MRFLCEWHNDWVQLFQHCRWYTITFLYWYFEYDRIGNAIEATFIIFGFGFRLRWCWNFESSEIGKLLREYEKNEREGERKALTRIWEQTHQKDDEWLV